MTFTLRVSADSLNRLDIAPAQALLEEWLQGGSIKTYEQQLCFEIDYPREPGDPRELPEIPEVRLWFLRLDARYPWLPFVLDWKTGELARYTAMLVPHEFSTQEGIQYNPEALEIFVMQKIFILTDWLQQQGMESRSRLKGMAQMLGYELEDGLFDLIRA